MNMFSKKVITMKHIGTKNIETERLILRRFTLDDADAMYRNWVSDDEVTKYLTWPAHSSVDITKWFLLIGLNRIKTMIIITGQ